MVHTTNIENVVAVSIQKTKLTPNSMYAAITLPAIVEKPPVITACISDLVISNNIGFIIKYASGCKHSHIILHQHHYFLVALYTT